MPERESGQGALAPLERIRNAISTFETVKEGFPRLTEGIVAAAELETLTRYVEQFPDRRFTPMIKEAFESYAKELEKVGGTHPENFPQPVLDAAKNLEQLYYRVDSESTEDYSMKRAKGERRDRDSYPNG